MQIIETTFDNPPTEPGQYAAVWEYNDVLWAQVFHLNAAGRWSKEDIENESRNYSRWPSANFYQYDRMNVIFFKHGT